MSGKPPKVHNFRESLDWSNSKEVQEYWLQVYGKLFGDIGSISEVTGKNQAQRLGIDRVIVLKSGKILRIEEKTRKKDHEDILLEYESGHGDGKGWANKKLLADYFAYGMPSQAYVWPYENFRRVWTKRKYKWIKEYKTIQVRNIGWTTKCIAVPIEVFQKEIMKTMLIPVLIK